MSQTFQTSQNVNGSVLSLEVQGAVDEDASFSDIVLPNPCTEVVINLASVSLINSCGIRSWVKWIKALPKETKLVLINCPKILIDQVNMVDGFLPPGAEVRSFQVPFFCEKCENTVSVLFNRGVEYNGPKINNPKNISCLTCGGPTELDVIESKYFKFLASQS